ncbi:MAG: hypothetical protein E6Q97_30345 [Desulfurellales bacterium]|nr:MAG: hypothetical protein E6Q97_30345 [Desulfurellales bacterium]
MQPDPETLIDAAIAAASKTWGVSPQVITSRNRTEAVLKPRFAIYHFAVCHLGLAANQAGKILNLDHGTILNGIRKLDAWRSTSKVVRQQVEEFYARVGR